jgi:pimeloyl-ACP methyl ester carboxylesterase
LGHNRGAQRGYPLALVKDLDGRRCRSQFHAFLHQRVGHAVEVGVEGDVIVDVHSSVELLVHVERLGGQRSQGRAFNRGEHTGDPSLSREMHEKISGSQLVILPKSGHMTFVDQPGLFLAAVAHFLSNPYTQPLKSK